MNTVRLYDASLIVVGGALGGTALVSILEGELTMVSILLAVGGIGMVVATVYDAVFERDSSDSIPDDRLVWVVVGCAVLVVLGAIGSLLG